jgi:hypothetical protein
MVIEMERDMNLYLDEKPTAVQAQKAGPVAMDTTESGYAATAQKAGDSGPVSRGYTEEIEHWAWCIRNRDPQNLPRCDAKTGLGDATIALVSNQAIMNKERIEFQPEWFEIDSDETPKGIKPDVNRPEYKI